MQEETENLIHVYFDYCDFCFAIEILLDIYIYIYAYKYIHIYTIKI